MTLQREALISTDLFKLLLLCVKSFLNSSNDDCSFSSTPRKEVFCVPREWVNKPVLQDGDKCNPTFVKIIICR